MNYADDHILIAEVAPTAYTPFPVGSLESMTTDKLLSTWQELDANGRRTKNGFPVDLSNLETAIRARVVMRLSTIGIQVVYTF